jgi:transcriptional adapter 3
VEVTEDFTKVKSTPQQTPVSTFYTSIEPWLRGIREEDVGWLEYTGDEVEPYVMPKLGRHYTEVWEEEDIVAYGGVPTSLDFSKSHPGPSHPSSSTTLPKWDSSTLTDADLPTEKGLGPMTERLVSAMLPVDDKLRKEVTQAEDALESRLSAGGAPTVNGIIPKEKVFVADFEGRVKETARYFGLVEGEVRGSTGSLDNL